MVLKVVRGIQVWVRQLIALQACLEIGTTTWSSVLPFKNGGHCPEGHAGHFETQTPVCCRPWGKPHMRPYSTLNLGFKSFVPIMYVYM
jgi:hypothetical protein